MASKEKKQKSYIVDTAYAIYCKLNCSNRGCGQCPNYLMNGTCRAVSEKIASTFLIKKDRIKEKFLPDNSLDYAITRLDGTKIVAHLIFDENTPMAWQNSANPDDLYMIDGIKDWSPILGIVEMTV